MLVTMKQTVLTQPPTTDDAWHKHIHIHRPHIFKHTSELLGEPVQLTKALSR